MNTLFLIFLFIFGTLFGSFASVLIYRLKSGEAGIMNGRSHCNTCNRILGALDLIPLVSWIKSKGQCYKCKKKISAIYPLLELSTGALFLGVGYFLTDINLILEGNILEISTLIFFLFIAFITILYTFYDILFLEIHDGIMAAGIGIILLVLGIQTLYPNIDIIRTIEPFYGNTISGIFAIILSLAIIAGLYAIMLKGMKEIWDFLILIIIGLSLTSFGYFMLEGHFNFTQIPILNGIAGVLGIFIFFFVQIAISGGKWMGGGDLRIAILIGLILGTSLSFPGLMLTYFSGSIIGIGAIIHSRLKNKGKGFENVIPFGPFLAIGFFSTLFFQNTILNFMNMYF